DFAKVISEYIKLITIDEAKQKAAETGAHTITVSVNVDEDTLKKVAYKMRDDTLLLTPAEQESIINIIKGVGSSYTKGDPE
ncbi:MAG: hypothetical protein LBV27_00220, partial [Oscillospiraceae bacterium]|nr:hypothetical protein [Oscillospiraceae bacterium]